MTNPVATEVDLDELEAGIRRTVAVCEAAGDGAFLAQSIIDGGKVTLALISEVRALRATGWKPLNVGDGELHADLREGETYLFAIELNGGGWEQFVDSLVWDSETPPDWRSGDAGWSLDCELFWMPLPSPPEVSND